MLVNRDKMKYAVSESNLDSLNDVIEDLCVGNIAYSESCVFGMT